MNPYRVLEFTNANKKRPVRIVAGMIVAFDYNTPTECNVIYSAGGVIIPVEESLDEIQAKLESINGPEGQGEVNATKESLRRPAVNVRKRKAR